MKKLKKKSTTISENGSESNSKPSYKNYLKGWGFQVWTRDEAGNKITGLQAKKNS